MSTFDSAGAPASQDINPNKNSHISSQSPKWSEMAIDTFSVHFYEEVELSLGFEKLDNPFLNALRSFSPLNEIFCPKCEALAKFSKHGKVKETFQFECTIGKHKVSAVQLLRHFPDEALSILVAALDNADKAQALEWIGKEHLSPELWEVKAKKNATKRFAIELSPIKDGSTKIRAINNSLESEVEELRRQLKEVAEKCNDWMHRYNAKSEECEVLKRHVLAKVDDETVSKKSYVDVAKIILPEIKKKNKAPKTAPPTPIEIISNPGLFAPTQKAAYSPLKLIYFEGCQRKNPSLYRTMFTQIGINNRSVRDITFLAQDILQITTYESSIEAITKALENISPTVKLIEDFDPCKGKSYSKYGDFSDELAKASYFAMMEQTATRLAKISETIKPLQRTATFLKKIVESKNTKYESPRRVPKCFVLGDFWIQPKAAEEMAEALEAYSDLEMTTSNIENEPINNGSQQ